MKKRLLYCVLFFITMTLVPFSAFSAEQSPQLIKVGLYYENTALISCTLSSKRGFTIGFRGGKDFTPLITLADTTLEIQSASYEDFVPVKESIFTEVEALSTARSMSDQGIDTYVFYDGTWSIWSKSASSFTKSDDILVIRSLNGYSIALPARRDESILIDGDGPISINQNTYRGNLELRLTQKGKIQVVNELSIEEYLYGVIPKEVTPSWHEEALKAQAVASRTYAINNLAKWAKYGFDVDSGVNDQVYGGVNAENPRTNMAVDDTRGQLIYYDNVPIAAFYHSDSGGFTEDCKYVFPSDLPYLKPAKEIYNSNSPHANWVMSLDDISENSPTLTREIGQLQSIDIIERSPSGRVIKAIVKGALGEKTLINSQVRSVLNLKSNFFEFKGTDSGFKSIAALSATGIEHKNPKDVWALTGEGLSTISQDELFFAGETNSLVLNSSEVKSDIIEGRGWGHGVGMSQWGAKAMAENGYNYKEILLHYYNNVEIK